MKIFDVTQYNNKNTSGVRISFLWMFSLMITHNENNGRHLSFGLGIQPLEVSMQLSLWRL